MSRRPPRFTLFPYPTLFRSQRVRRRGVGTHEAVEPAELGHELLELAVDLLARDRPAALGLEVHVQHVGEHAPLRSEEHTSELQSRQYLVCRLLLEKKKKHFP